jgi:plasmid stability protein
MAQIVIPNIDEAVIEGLRRRAGANGISIEEQARRILTSATGLDREAAIRRLIEVRRSIGRAKDASIIDDLRRDRDRNSAR